MSSRNMKLDEIEARVQAAFETTEQRKRDALLAWQALDVASLTFAWPGATDF